MAVYKVIQNVEAEDKLVGFLTFKGLVYAGIAILCGYINFRLLLIGTPVKWVLILAFLFPMILFGVLASPLGREQPTEVWLLSKLRFFLKPRLRIWNQTGLEELVTVTAPKRAEEHLTKDMDQTEVHSRLKTLASTLDTRGWAVKHVDVNLNVATPFQTPGTVVISDRLVQDAELPQTAPISDVQAADDIMDEQNNPTAQKFANMMEQADDDRRRGLMAAMKGLTTKPSANNHTRPKIVKKTDLESQLVQARTSLKSISPSPKIDIAKPQTAPTILKQPPKPVLTPVTPERQAVNMELAQSGSAFSVSTLSQLANRQPQIEQTGPNEVTISLH